MLVSKKIHVGEENFKYFIDYFIGYYHNHKVKPLNIMLPKPIVKSYEVQTKWMYFLIEDDDLLEKYNTVWDKVSGGIIFWFSINFCYRKARYQILF